MAFNKAYQRTGKLFEEHFGRIEVNSDTYLTNLIFYIHFNPQKHGFVNNFCEWPWSSYSALHGTGETKLQRAEVLNWFGDSQQFDTFHTGNVAENTIVALIADDWD